MYRSISVLTLLLVLSHNGLAAAFVDPMRPFDGLGVTKSAPKEKITPKVNTKSGMAGAKTATTTATKKSVTKRSEKFWLQSIMITPTFSRAVINGKMVSPGDRIGSTHVTHIEHNAVLLRRGLERITLNLMPVSIKGRTP